MNTHFPLPISPLIRQGTGPIDAAIQRETRARHRDQQIARIIQNNTEPTTEPIRAATRATLPGDSRRLRGIPAIGYGVTGAIPGTTPGTLRNTKPATAA